MVFLKRHYAIPFRPLKYNNNNERCDVDDFGHVDLGYHNDDMSLSLFSIYSYGGETGDGQSSYDNHHHYLYIHIRY